ncbi:DNA-binding transcriptional regulator, LysR family [Enhydrobacter aerosaccus]|uniref:DNA-binding transcriptional regulator, LysR family n=1 Tax=Enhydrobacter aerosaccus TaxID=225324 RepID=A0A1T4TEH7_9HYPH|nr:LysR family transcriptional regulator [Enhydrobacter aerosaccus]SKA38609.1 DNA-binding transcriptional regulator, LysR family [Enhydrobacter aerosaccus]
MTSISPRKSKVPNILGDWDDVRFFLAVAKTGSFSAAATQLNTKQTTVGRRIQALERRLGAKLFDRHRHGMEVTPAARGVLVQAESMLSNATSIERHLAGLDREMSGVVRVAATEGLAAQWLVPRLTELRRMHSDILVQVIVGDQVLDLATRQADLAIRFFRPTSNQLVAARVGQFAMSIFAAPAYVEQYGMPQRLDDLRAHHIVDHTTLHSLPSMKPWSEVVEQSPNVVLRTNSSHSAIEAVKAAWGISVFPSYISKTANLVEVPIELNITRDIWLVSHEETNKGARIRAVIDYIREKFRQDEREWFSLPSSGRSMVAA